MFEQMAVPESLVAYFGHLVVFAVVDDCGRYDHFCELAIDRVSGVGQNPHLALVDGLIAEGVVFKLLRIERTCADE